MIRKVVVLGGGSAGFIAALSLKTRLPQLSIQLIRSPDIGIIGVGEGSTIAFTSFLHDFLRVNRQKFFEIARPTWKLGLHFIWGKRPYFHYSFAAQMDRKGNPKIARANGYYCDENVEFADPLSAMMTLDKAFECKDGRPMFHDSVAYHFENENFVTYLEQFARVAGVTITDGTVQQILQSEIGVDGLVLADGQTVKADLYIDASGFRSELLGKTLGEKYHSYADTLFCDRAVVGGWPRGTGDQTIKPYTTCETMDAGWCWQIEHENRINRGYVYSSAFISDSDAEAEFRRKNPKVSQTRIVKFTSGRYDRAWVKNVVGVGNSSGFVEPLEATALGNIGAQCRTLAETLFNCDCIPRSTVINCYNRLNGYNWDSIRGFLGIHYKYNNRLDTPFWKHCHEKTNLADAAEVAEYYQENGPDGYWGAVAINKPYDQFTIAGYIALMVGMRVPYRKTYMPVENEIAEFEAFRANCRAIALRSMTVREALAAVRAPGWQWPT